MSNARSDCTQHSNKDKPVVTRLLLFAILNNLIASTEKPWGEKKIKDFLLNF